MKKFLSVILVIVLLIAVGVGYVYMNIDNIAKNMAEKVGSEQLGVPVTIEKMNVDIMQKSVSLSGLKISNPQAFSSNKAIQVSSVSTRLGELKKDLITIEELTIGNIDVLLEVANQTTNLQSIQSNLPKTSQDSSSQSNLPDFIIKKVMFGQTSLEPKIANFDKQIGTLTVPGFTVNNIGTAENGVSAGEAVRQIMAPYLRKIEKQAIEGQLMKQLPADFEGLKSKMETQSRDIQQKAGDSIKEKTKELDKKLQDSLNNVFGE